MEFKKYGKTEVGEDCVIQANVIIGAAPKKLLKNDSSELPGAKIGDGCVLRSGTIVYSDVKTGNKLKTGHNVLIREDTIIGDNVIVGTNSIIEDKCSVGNNVSIQSNVYIPTNTTIADNVFIGPNACLTNDKYPVRIKDDLVGPIIEKGVSVGANATILPGVRIGEGSVIAAGAVVTKDVGPWKLVVGVPGKEKDLPEKLRILNKIE